MLRLALESGIFDVFSDGFSELNAAELGKAVTPTLKSCLGLEQPKQKIRGLTPGNFVIDFGWSKAREAFGGPLFPAKCQFPR